MKRILFLCLSCALITNVNAQQFYNHLAADSYIQLHEPFKLYKKHIVVQKFKMLRGTSYGLRIFLMEFQILGLTMGTIPILMEFKYLFLI